MAKYTGPGERLQAAKVLTDQAELRELALYQFSYVKAAVAGNGHSTPSILMLLVEDMFQPLRDEDYQVASVIMGRADLTLEVAVAFCTALEPNLQRIEPRDYEPRDCWKHLVGNARVPIQCFESLLSSDACPRHLRRLAVASTRRRDVLEKLVCDPCGSVSTRAKRKLQADIPQG
ncbi:hypothetical protein [Roseimicrobium sp. ORNL1]|uniref:hypothetical protein n=1 Tax=Roseimicrobium sp. ORNL1 TaxID=2711231 RepID=UPI0013E172A2|nr:hypothetical protein [Roseimicrobium sp. ORNL1]QIF05830.1 hypothetical protein G5S37_31515 [Roseimicrobium sp. ORNL1]